MITAEQIKAARALLRLEQEDLARKAGVSVSTIRRLEAATGAGVAMETAQVVQHALEEAGVAFIHDGVQKKPAGDRDKLAMELLSIAQRSAALLHDKPILTDADLYGEDGLPA